MNDKAFAKQPLPYFEFENLRMFSVFLLFNVHCQCSVFNVMHTNNSRWASCQCNFLPFSSPEEGSIQQWMWMLYFLSWFSCIRSSLRNISFVSPNEHLPLLSFSVWYSRESNIKSCASQ